jgi:hypothetical protein
VCIKKHEDRKKQEEIGREKETAREIPSRTCEVFKGDTEYIYI